MEKEKVIIILGIILTILILFDAVSTLVGVGIFGFQELNPIATRVFDVLGVSLGITYLLIISISFIWIGIMFSLKGKEKAKVVWTWVLIFLITSRFAIVFGNILALFRM